MSINEIQDQIIEEFSAYTELMDKYKAILLAGRRLDPLDDKYKIQENAIKGCQSTVWIIVEKVDGKLNFKADSETLVTKGILALILRVFQNQTPKDIYTSNLYFVERVGLKAHLSPSRANGLGGILQHIHEVSKNYLGKN